MNWIQVDCKYRTNAYDEDIKAMPHLVNLDTILQIRAFEDTIFKDDDVADVNGAVIVFSMDPDSIDLWTPESYESLRERILKQQAAGG